LPVQDMYGRIRAGKLPAPQIPLGKRCYFTADEVDRLGKESQ